MRLVRLNLTLTRLSYLGSLFRDPSDGQAQAILSCLLQKGVCKETTGITKRGMPSMRSVLLFRFCLPHVDTTTTLPDLWQIPLGDVQKFSNRPKRHRWSGSLRRHMWLSFWETPLSLSSLSFDSSKFLRTRRRTPRLNLRHPLLMIWWLPDLKSL